ncbi:hypothetical protein ACFYUD_30680 [Nocardia tengchongensis]|uniref:hypothetical protein n=1 Tax=Nocardia tengchongensis TaxID=2055889 RepID=UPI00369032F5
MTAVCQCLVPPTPRQLAEKSDLVVAGAITAVQRHGGEQGGADYTLSVSRVLLQRNADQPTTVTFHVVGKRDCCSGAGLPLPMNSEQVLFLPRRDADTSTVIFEDPSRMSVRGGSVSYGGFGGDAVRTVTLDQLAIEIADR